MLLEKFKIKNVKHYVNWPSEFTQFIKCLRFVCRIVLFSLQNEKIH